MGTRRERPPRSGCPGSVRRRRTLAPLLEEGGLGRRVTAFHVHLAVEERALGDRHELAADVSAYARAGADLDALGQERLGEDFAVHHEARRLEVADDRSALADGVVAAHV